VAFDAVTDRSWEQVCLEYLGRGCPVSLTALVQAIRERSTWYWSDPERHREGRLNILEARRGFVTEAFAALGLPAADAVALADRYSVVRLDNMHVMDGAHAVLSRLRSAGIRLALVTNGDGPGQRDKIRRFGLGGYFSAVLIEGETGFGKPDPRAFRSALEALGVAAAEACMVGDNLIWDIAGPQALGIATVWIDRAGAGVPPGSDVKPTWIARGVHEVPEVLLGEVRR
jgi:putative hydrolase of the HAD superfamily